jgi:ABC-2 type transport system ATP-binding protein
VPDAVIDLCDLSRHYGLFAAVSGLDLKVGAGEIFALLGPNGAGKTTTLRMLMGVLQPSGGTAKINGLDCAADRAVIQRQVGYLPDEPVFYDYLTGREIVHFVGEMRGYLPAEVTRRALPLWDRLRLAGDLDEYAVNYSHGMKKKLAAVCALLHAPPVLILDEPTNGLDPLTTRTMHEIIRERAAAGACVLFSTHLLDQAEKLCDRVGILHKGRLVAVGKLSELRASLAANSTLEEIFFSVTKDTDEGTAP